MRLIRLVVAASSSVLSVDDETKMNRKKHECSLLEALSDAGSTPAASTNIRLSKGLVPFERAKPLLPKASIGENVVMGWLFVYFAGRSMAVLRAKL
jgi:hypothetical protein